MTPDERTALNEAVCKRLGWTNDFVWLDVEGGEHVGWAAPNGEGWYHDFPPHDFTSDWNAVYRWLCAAVKEMELEKREEFADTRLWHAGGARRGADWFLYATPEDYCRAFMTVTEANDGE